MEVMKRLIASTAAAAVLLVGVVSVAVAQPGDQRSDTSTLTQAVPLKITSGAATHDQGEIPVDFDESPEHGFLEGEECFVDWEPSADEIAEINAEADALVLHLAALGFTVTVVTDELGVRYIDFDENTDEALFEAINDFHLEQWADEVAGWSDAEKAEWNAHIEEFVADLAARGIAAETEEIAPGVIDTVWTEELEMALMELEGGEFFFEEGTEDDWEPSADEIAEINAEHDALVAHLDGLGFTVSVAADELGIRYLDFEAMGEDEALWMAVDDFYHQRFLEEIANWSDAEKAEWNAHIEEFVADLAARGIAAETEEIAPGVIDTVWTEELEMALMELEGENFPLGERECEEWMPGPEEIAEINAETDALVAHLEGLGYTVSVAADELGIRYLDFEAMGDDEALWTAVDDFYHQRFLEEIANWSDAEKAEWNAHIEEIVADLATNGITVETEVIAPGVYDIVWTEDVEMALEGLEASSF